MKTEAYFNGVLIASTEKAWLVDGNPYFPPEDVNFDRVIAVEGGMTVCPYKGTANYYDVTDGDARLGRGAWAYHNPIESAAEIKGHIAFYPQVEIRGREHAKPAPNYALNR